jgi:hypothetical protein
MPWNPDRILVYRKPSHDRPARHRSPGASNRRARIGIWDLDASVGALPTLLDAIEEQQDFFSFYSVEAPLCSGLTATGDHVALDWKDVTGHAMPAEAAAANVVAGPILEAAAPILHALPIEWLVVVVESMISDTTDPEDAWHNLFSTTDDHVALVSTYGLRDYAARANRPFEAAVLGSALSAVLSELVPGIEYQDISTGSLFDHCVNRDDIVLSIRTPTIDPQNRARFSEDVLVPTEKVLRFLRDYQGDVARRPRATKKVAKPRPAKKVSKPKAPRAAGMRNTAAVAKASPSDSRRADFAFRDALKALGASLPRPKKKA